MAKVHWKHCGLSPSCALNLQFCPTSGNDIIRATEVALTRKKGPFWLIHCSLLVIVVCV